MTKRHETIILAKMLVLFRIELFFGFQIYEWRERIVRAHQERNYLVKHAGLYWMSTVDQIEGCHYRPSIIPSCEHFKTWNGWINERLIIVLGIDRKQILICIHGHNLTRGGATCPSTCRVTSEGRRASSNHEFIFIGGGDFDGHSTHFRAC